MDDRILMAVGVGVAVLVVAFLLFPSLISGESGKRKKKVLEGIHAEGGELDVDAGTAVLKDQYRMSDSDAVNSLLNAIPGMRSTHALLLRAGSKVSIGQYILFSIIGFFVLSFVFSSMMGFGGFGMLLGLLGTILLPRKWLLRKIDRRSLHFLNMFPDAIDMMVRSVRSGHPFTAALRMIAENMEPPVSQEFKQVVDEIAYGRTVQDALRRMSQRIPEPDVQFFVVIIGVQQETGGNLSEVLSNLSGILRKRKQLRLKIRAITSEGRATGYILGALPFVVVLALHFISPGYLEPLWTTGAGKVVLVIDAVLIFLALFTVKKMLEIDV